MNLDLSTLLIPCVLLAIVLVVVATELIKKIDKKNRLKGYRIYIPAVLSAVASAVLAFGDFYTYKQAAFYGAVIFAFSVFFYEAILKKIENAVESKNENS